MPDDDFIEAYTQGQIPRRAFVRRLVVGGLSLGSALAYATALAPAAAASSGSGRKKKPDDDSCHNHHNHHNHHRAPERSGRDD